MPVRVGDVTLVGRVTNIGPATRPLRDAITGEELPTPEDEATVVIRATVVFSFDERPDSLTLVAPRETGLANIGFVLYHKGVAVNDYRYLSSGNTVNLDWQDAWYSAFPERGLRRQYYSPMTGFIYVEPYEVRKEIIVRPSDIQRYVDLGLDGETIIPAERHDEIKDLVVEFLSGHFPVKIDGEPVEGTVDRVNFLRRTLRSSIVVDKQDLELLPATIGVIYVFPTDGLPQNVEMEWDLFNDKIQLIPAASVDQAGALPVYLEPDYAVLVWQNFLKNPVLPTLAVIAAPPSTVARVMLYLRWLLLAATLVLLIRWLYGLRDDGPVGAALYGLGAAALVSAAAFYLGQAAVVSDERGQEIVGGLLHNVYRAFDFRDEGKIYDVLLQSVEGELLTKIYLETRRGLELASQGGARAKVKSIELTELTTRPSDDAGFVANATWTVAGAVGHWGHLHQRANRYKADMRVQPVNGNWKLTGLEILEEERL